MNRPKVSPTKEETFGRAWGTGRRPCPNRARRSLSREGIVFPFPLARGGRLCDTLGKLSERRNAHGPTPGGRRQGNRARGRCNPTASFVLLMKPSRNGGRQGLQG